MYSILVFCHSIVRWLLLVAMLYAIYRAFKGYFYNSNFSKLDNAIRHWTATIAHIQLVIGIILYSQSPLVKYFWNNFSVAIHNMDAMFFGIVHITLMLSAIVLVTIGSALAKRKLTSREKFKTQLTWFSVSLAMVLIAIPWPFSPLSNRPYLR